MRGSRSSRWSVVALTLLWSAPACRPAVCGTSSHVGVVTADLAAVDADPSTPAIDLIEVCGPDGGSFGERRPNCNYTTVTFSPNAADGKSDSDYTVTYELLPVATVAFATEHRAVGQHLDMSELAGGGVQLLDGPSGTYADLALLDGTLDVVATRPDPRAHSVVFGDEQPEMWKLTWNLTYGDPQSGVVYQTWEGTDWVEITNAVTGGTLDYAPPDWSDPNGTCDPYYYY